MREDYETDPQGRRVRTKHAVTVKRSGKSVTRWGDKRTAGRNFVESALQQRRNQIVGDCFQLKMDKDNFNDYHNDGEPIQIPLDFTPDVEELEEMAKLKKDAA